MTLEAGGQRGELLLLHGELGLLILQRLGGVDDRSLRARLHLDELLAHVDALLQRRDQRLLRADRRRQLVALRRLLLALRLERGEIGGELAEIGVEHLVLAGAERVGNIGRPGDCGDRIRGSGLGRRQLRLPPQRLGARRAIFRLRGLRLRFLRRPVEFDQRFAGRHHAVVRHMDRRHPSGLDRLDDLDAPGRLKLALRGGDDVDPADIGPDDGDRGKRADQPEERHPHGGSGRLQDFEGGGEEFAVGEMVAAAPSTGRARWTATALAAPARSGRWRGFPS